MLTKVRRRDIIVKLSPRGTPQSEATVIENRTTRDESTKQKSVYGNLVNSNLRIKNTKKSEKTFKNLLTNGIKVGIIEKLSDEEMRRAGIGL